MAKKTDNTTAPAPAKPVKRLVATAPKDKAGNKPSRKPTRIAAPKSAAPTSKAKKPAAPKFTREEVALRAYFIAEKRHAHGLPGNEHQDWLEAERQLAAGSARSRKVKMA